MNEFTTRTDRLMERVRRGIIQCDYIEQQACIAEERLTKFDKSIKMLTRLIEVSFLLLMSSDKEKLPKQFLSHLESYLKRELIDDNEKQAYIQALYLLQSSSTISSDFF
jgi:hypothetical protein